MLAAMTMITMLSCGRPAVNDIGTRGSGAVVKGLIANCTLRVIYANFITAEHLQSIRRADLRVDAHRAAMDGFYGDTKTPVPVNVPFGLEGWVNAAGSPPETPAGAIDAVGVLGDGGSSSVFMHRTQSTVAAFTPAVFMLPTPANDAST